MVDACFSVDEPHRDPLAGRRLACVLAATLVVLSACAPASPSGPEVDVGARAPSTTSASAPSSASPPSRRPRPAGGPWVEYASAECGFEILLPGEPTFTSEDRQRVRASSRAGYVSVSRDEITTPSVGRAAHRLGAVQTAFIAFGGSLAGTRELQLLDDHDATEGTGTRVRHVGEGADAHDEPFEVTALAFFVGARFYLITIASPAGAPIRDEVMASLRLTTR